MNSTLLLGIDIGWSEKKRSSSVSAVDTLGLIDWPTRACRYGDVLFSSCFRYSEVIRFLSNIQAATSEYDRVIAVFDGPIGSNGRPTNNRFVDSAFRRGEFYRRMQPVDVDTNDGRTYVDATYATIEALIPGFNSWMGRPPANHIVVTETNPTVGLALMSKKYNTEVLPTRTRPLMPPTSDRVSKAIRAKSDFYWTVGGATACSIILGSERVADEMHHERVASLYCLAVAASIASDNYCACGSEDDGVYMFPSGVHPDWINDIQGVGIVAGQLRESGADASSADLSQWPRAEKAVRREATDKAKVIDEPDDEIECELAYMGDDEILLLNDNGGVWEKHNEWLADMESPVHVISRTSV